MSRFIILLAVLAVCVAVIAASDPAKKPQKKKMPPAGMKKMTTEQKKQHLHMKYSRHGMHRAAVAIPSSFDARTKWPNCKSISDIRDQGSCGTCWAVSSASVMSDRLCISSNGANQDYVSAVNIAACTDLSQTGTQNCEDGGDPAHAYKQATIYGVCSGGNYGSNSGCQPYSVAPGKKLPLTCSKTCSNPKFSKSPANDAHFVDSYWTTYVGDNPTSAQIKANIEQMQVEIMTNGPITAAIACWTDFQDWTPGQAPYAGPGYDAQDEGGHAIRVIGWGVSKVNGKSYWLIANSWGTDVGDKGVYQIEMGRNVVGIEGTISAPIVKLPNTCGSFCDAPLDQIIRSKPTDPKSPVFAFQGNCTVQVNIGADGKMTPVGTPGPISKLFVGGPPGPITKWMTSGSDLWIMNPSGTAGACKPVSGSTKQECSGGTASSGAAAQTVSASTGNKYVYYNEPGKNEYMFSFRAGSSSGSGTPIDDTITNVFQSVNALLDIDGRKMLVCGSDKRGNGQCGVMSTSDFSWVTQPGPNVNLLKC